MDLKQYNNMLELYRENIEKGKGKGRKDCITMLRYAIDKLYDKKTVMLGERITEDIDRLESANYIEWRNNIYSVDKNGKLTNGMTCPVMFADSWDRFLFPNHTTYFDFTARNAFILSLLDGYHAVMLLTTQVRIPDTNGGYKVGKNIYYLDNNEVSLYSDFGNTGLSLAGFTTEMSLKMKIWWESERDRGKLFKSRCIVAKLSI